jgi:hypothetical protein
MEGVLIKQLAIRLGYQKTIDKSLVIVLPVWLVRQVETYPLNVCFV